MDTKEFKNVTILLPAMDETYSLSRTVEIITDTCKKEDLAEIIIIVCDRTEEKTLKTAKNIIEQYGRRDKRGDRSCERLPCRDDVE